MIFYRIIAYLAPFFLKIGAVFLPKLKDFNATQVLAKSQMLSLYSLPKTEKIVWFHCASLGEFEQGRPVIEALRFQNLSLTIVLSFFSSSGYAIRKNYDQVNKVVYLPLDHPVNSLKFLEILKPDFAIFVKYEFWPFYTLYLKQLDIPFIGISVILRQNHIANKFYGGIIKNSIKRFSSLFIQDNETLKMLNSWGLENINLVGDTRFDRVLDLSNKVLPNELIQNWKGENQLIVAGSTWPEDETLLFSLYENLHNIKLIIVPHEIDLDHIIHLKQKFSAQLFSEIEPLTNNRCIVVDSIGHLSSLYKMADIAYVGGAFGKGLHNILEAATYGMPIIFGNKNYKKFNEALALINLKVAFAVSDYTEAQKIVKTFLTDSNLLKTTSITAKNYVSKNAGATLKITKYIWKYLS